MFSPKFLRQSAAMLAALVMLGLFGQPVLAQDAAPLPQTGPIYILLDAKSKQCRWYGGIGALADVPAKWKSYEVSSGSGKNNVVELPGGTCDFSTIDIKSCCEKIGYTYNSETSFAPKPGAKNQTSASTLTTILAGLGLAVVIGAGLVIWKRKKQPHDYA